MIFANAMKEAKAKQHMKVPPAPRKPRTRLVRAATCFSLHPVFPLLAFCNDGEGQWLLRSPPSHLRSDTPVVGPPKNLERGPRFRAYPLITPGSIPATLLLVPRDIFTNKTLRDSSASLSSYCYIADIAQSTNTANMAPALKAEALPDSAPVESVTQESNAGRRGKKRPAADTPNPVDDKLDVKRLRSVDQSAAHSDVKDGNSGRVPAGNDEDVINNRKQAHDFVKLAMKAVTAAKDDR